MLQALLAQGYVLNAPQPPPVAPLPQAAGPPPPALVNPAAHAPLPPHAQALPPHLAAFGAGVVANPFQVAPFPGPGVSPQAHIINTVNNNNNYGAPASLMSSMSAGLVPMVPGQLPSMAELVDRRAKDWKPYHSDAEFREALQDWYASILRLHPFDTARHKAAHDYVMETSVFIEKVGYQKAFEYHKAAFKAANRIPPQYDPLVSPIYTLGYMTLIHPHLKESGINGNRRTFNRSESAPGARFQNYNQRNGANKRPRPNTTCSLHPNGNHSDAECKAQYNRRRTVGGGTNSAAPNNS